MVSVWNEWHERSALQPQYSILSEIYRSRFIDLEADMHINNIIYVSDWVD